jgi:hypothetical protein
MTFAPEKAWFWIGVIAILLFSVLGGLISFLFTAWLIFWAYKMEEYDYNPNKHPVWAQVCAAILILSFVIVVAYYINPIMIFAAGMGMIYSFLYSKHIHHPEAW